MNRHLLHTVILTLFCFSFCSSAGARQISQYHPYKAFISDDYKCSEIAKITVTAPDERNFQGDVIDLRRLVGPVRGMLTRDCQKLKQIDVMGTVNGKEVYHGRLMASKRWIFFKVPTQTPGKKGIRFDENDEIVIYQDKKLTLKGPPMNAVSSWCGAGSGTNRSPLYVRVFYTVDHLERDTLFAPGYADFVQKNVVPLVKDYCGRVPPIIQLNMMDSIKKYQNFDSLTFKMMNGKAVGNSYTPPSPYVSKQLDPEKLEAFIWRMAKAQNDTERLQAQIRKERIEPNHPIKSGQLRRFRKMSSHTDLYWQCAKEMNIYIQTSRADSYKGNLKNLQTLIDAERAEQLKKCPRIERFIINGALDGRWHFRGTCSKSENWVVKGNLIQNDDKYLQPYMFPEDPADKYKLGLMYFSGERLAVNQSIGASKIKDAAQYGYAEAQYHLGRLYEEGKGVEAHIYKAKKWYKMAAKQGHQKAIAHMRDLEENGKLSDKKKMATERARRKNGIVYKSARFWQEFSDFKTPQKIFDGQFSGLVTEINFKNFYVDFVAGYSRYCRQYLPSQCDTRTYMNIEIEKDEMGFEKSRTETGPTTIYIDPRFTAKFDQYQNEVNQYNKVNTLKVMFDMRKNIEKQSISDSVSEAVYQLQVFETEKFFSKVPGDSATMKQMWENLLRAANTDPSVQASGVVFTNAEKESDSVKDCALVKTFEKACLEYHNERLPGQYDEWCSCLYREARKVMTPDELAYFTDNFGLYYTEIDNKQEGPNDPRWRLQKPLNKCRR